MTYFHDKPLAFPADGMILGARGKNCYRALSNTPVLAST